MAQAAGRIRQINRNDFDLINMIGTGAYGKVYVGNWWNEAVVDATTVAVKVVSLNDNDQTHTDMEVEILVSLNHNHVVKLFGICSYPSEMYIIMEYAERGSLKDLRQSREYNPSYLKDYALQVALGMDYLHSQEPAILHRDLKTANVLVFSRPLQENKAYTLKIADFGLAKYFSSTCKMSWRGTIRWMAPEVLQDSSFSKKSDVWSYGVLIWELVTGMQPYGDLSNNYAVMCKVVKGKLTPGIPESSPKEMRKLIKSCWQRKYEERPSFSEVLNTLQSSGESQIQFEPTQISGGLSCVPGISIFVGYVAQRLFGSRTTHATTYHQSYFELYGPYFTYFLLIAALGSSINKYKK